MSKRLCLRSYACNYEQVDLPENYTERDIEKIISEKKKWLKSLTDFDTCSVEALRILLEFDDAFDKAVKNDHIDTTGFNNVESIDVAYLDDRSDSHVADFELTENDTKSTLRKRWEDYCESKGLRNNIIKDIKFLVRNWEDWVSTTVECPTDGDLVVVVTKENKYHLANYKYECVDYDNGDYVDTFYDANTGVEIPYNNVVAWRLIKKL